MKGQVLKMNEENQAAKRDDEARDLSGPDGQMRNDGRSSQMDAGDARRQALGEHVAKHVAHTADAAGEAGASGSADSLASADSLGSVDSLGLSDSSGSTDSSGSGGSSLSHVVGGKELFGLQIPEIPVLPNRMYESREPVVSPKSVQSSTSPASSVSPVSSASPVSSVSSTSSSSPTSSMTQTQGQPAWGSSDTRSKVESSAQHDIKHEANPAEDGATQTQAGIKPETGTSAFAASNPAVGSTQSPAQSPSSAQAQKPAQEHASKQRKNTGSAFGKETSSPYETTLANAPMSSISGQLGQQQTVFRPFARHEQEAQYNPNQTSFQQPANPQNGYQQGAQQGAFQQPGYQTPAAPQSGYQQPAAQRVMAQQPGQQQTVPQQTVPQQQPPQQSGSQQYSQQSPYAQQTVSQQPVARPQTMPQQPASQQPVYQQPAVQQPVQQAAYMQYGSQQYAPVQAAPQQLSPQANPQQAPAAYPQYGAQQTQQAQQYAPQQPVAQPYGYQQPMYQQPAPQQYVAPQQPYTPQYGPQQPAYPQYGYQQPAQPQQPVYQAYTPQQLGVTLATPSYAYAQPVTSGLSGRRLRYIYQTQPWWPQLSSWLGMVRKRFSTVGLALAMVMVVWNLLAFGLTFLVRVVTNGAKLPMWASFLVGNGPLYLVAIPLSLLIFRRLPVVKRKTSNMSFSMFLTVMAITFPLSYLGSQIGTLLSSMLSHGQARSSISEMIGSMDPLTILLTTVIIGPIFEEWLFRRLIIDHIQQYGEVTAIVVSAGAFALFHGNLFQFFYVFFFGLLEGYVYVRTGKLRYTIAMHMTYNFCGGFLPQMALMATSSDAYKAIASGSSQAIAKLITTGHFGDLAPLLLYSVFQWVMIITGVIVAIVNRKKLVFYKAPEELPKGLRAKTAVGNVGICIFIVLCALEMILALSVR
ncbi:CPBP family glutamic-type intramembrane protease [Bifidobacterium sp. ESL0790]|uniref:CPBP family glutamic-type intramembrane protease n=1 Tax=Bifidobacterium sp. ESL0790 TaxID=2983233 RepID=UPI0023F68003|nr:CPBP family glutamic-type intramembrane protease [Bifidobacterium sp. ESL0790]WEV72636.1 CPBP family glutamic-type intramembrane protease [Bifidobacterium sp. ESL0790]